MARGYVMNALGPALPSRNSFARIGRKGERGTGICAFRVEFDRRSCRVRYGGSHTTTLTHDRTPTRHLSSRVPEPETSDRLARRAEVVTRAPAAPTRNRHDLSSNRASMLTAVSPGARPARAAAEAGPAVTCRCPAWLAGPRGCAVAGRGRDDLARNSHAPLRATYILARKSSCGRPDRPLHSIADRYVRQTKEHHRARCTH